MTDKNQAMIDYLMTCKTIKDNPLFFNYVDAKNNSKQLITSASDTITDKRYIDGSVLRKYTCTIIDFKSIATNAVVNTAGYSDENVEDMNSVQQIINWVTDQNKKHHYPDFGPNCVVQEIKALTTTPRLGGIDNQASPPLVQYTVTIRVDYLDKSDMLWK